MSDNYDEIDYDEMHYKETHYNHTNLKLKQELSKNIKEFLESSSLIPIQTHIISSLIAKKNIKVQSHPGIGKTLALCIGALEILNANNKKCQIIILAPTKELIISIHRQIYKLSRDMKVSCYASIKGFGNGFEEDEHEDDINAQILVTAPAKALRLINNNKLDIKYVKSIILDDANSLLSAHKVPIHNILNCMYKLNKNIQLCMITTILTKNVDNTFDNYCQENKFVVKVKDAILLQENTKHYIVTIDSNDKTKSKISALRSICEKSDDKVLVFCKGKDQVDLLNENLLSEKLNTCALHGAIENVERKNTIEEFLYGGKDILVATDVLSIGVNMQNLCTIINYDFPNAPEIYIHRAGRCGRFGREGKVYNLVTEEDENVLCKLDEKYFVQFKKIEARNLKKY
jgi:superfamily II DNA/RNA helicase